MKSGAFERVFSLSFRILVEKIPSAGRQGPNGMSPSRAGYDVRYRQKGRHHKSETLRKASKGLVRMHILVSDLSAISEAVSKASERPELFPLDC